MSLLTLSDSLIAHFLLFLQVLRSLLLLDLTGFNCESDHFFLFSCCCVSFLLSDPGHLHDYTHLLIFIVGSCASCSLCGLFRINSLEGRNFLLSSAISLCRWLRDSRLFHQLLHRDLIDLHILLDHHLLECFKIVNAENLLDNSMMSGVPRASLACFLELLASDTHFCD